MTPRYCEADPFEGGKQAVAEAWRNLNAVGARPLALTDNLNFGNPERPEIMGQFVGCIRGIGEACRALDFPIVSGNVSLYNETNGRAILPTPTIGGVGLLDDFTTSMTLAFKAEGEAILLIGETQRLARPIGLSARNLRTRGGRAAAGRSRRRAPPWRFRPRLIHDRPGDGGPRCFRRRASGRAGRDGDGSRIGAVLEAPPGFAAHAFLVRRGSGPLRDHRKPRRRRGCATGDERRRAAARLGATGGECLRLPASARFRSSDLQSRFEAWLPAYMAGPA